MRKQPKSNVTSAPQWPEGARVQEISVEDRLANGTAPGADNGWRASRWIVVKDLTERVLAGMLLLVLAPLFLGVMLAVRLSSRGPIFYRQTRHGKDKIPFDIWKFRSMYVESCDARQSDRIWQATEGDPRVTQVGRLLRRTSLDELPQLLNVLAGEMALVGPRPHAIAEDAHYARIVQNYDGRFRMKPGITGLAQVSGLRGEIVSDDFMQRRIKVDNDYADQWSMALDLWILLRTVIVVFRKEQTY